MKLCSETLPRGYGVRVTAAPAPAPAKDRVSWVDTAKGGAIILVVLYHSTIFLADAGMPSILVRVLAGPDILPLFFFTAGMFASRAVSARLGVVFERRVVPLVWLYLLWTLIYTVVFSLIPPGTRPRPSLLGLLLSPVWPNESTWFIYGLALYFLFAWLIRPLPVPLQFAIAAALSIVFGTNWVNIGNVAIDKIGMYFVFFLAAVHFGPWARRHAARLTWWHSVLIFLGYAGTLAGLVKLDLFYVPGVRLFLGLLSLAAGVALAVPLSRLRWMSWMGTLGTLTLPVYLLHFYPVLILCAALAPVAPALRPYALLLAPLLALVAMLVSLGLFTVTRRVPWLYRPPRWLKRRSSPRTPQERESVHPSAV